MYSISEHKKKLKADFCLCLYGYSWDVCGICPMLRRIHTRPYNEYLKLCFNHS